MILRFLTLLVLLAPLAALAGTSGSTSTGSKIAGITPLPDPVFVQTEPLWTTVTETQSITGGTDTTYDTIATNLENVAITIRADIVNEVFPYPIASGEWTARDATDTGWDSDCEPAGDDSSDGNGLEDIARDAYTLALDFVRNGHTTSGDDAEALLLGVSATTTFDDDQGYGGREQECSLSLSEAVPALVNAALLLEEGGHTTWTIEDRVTFATWLAEEVFPPVTWAARNNKPNWGIAGIGAVYAIGVYTDGGYTLNLVEYDDLTSSSAAFYWSSVVFNTMLPAWLSTTDDLGDDGGFSCSGNGQVFGQQSNGAFSDDIRRTGTIADCAAADVGVSCTGPAPWTEIADCDDGIFYQQKSATLLARLCEMDRRKLGDDGSRCFDLENLPGASSQENLRQALLFGTTVSPDGVDDYQDARVETTMIAGYNVAGAYYRDQCMIEALRDSGASYFNRGGPDFPWTALTHYPGVTNTAPAACGGEEFVTMTASTLASDPDLRDRVPTIYNPGQVVTTDWAYYDATCKCTTELCGTTEDAASSACTVVSGIVDESGASHTVLPIPSSWTYGPVPIDGTTSVTSIHRNLLMNDMSDDEMLVFPDGEYIYNTGWQAGFAGSMWRPDIFSDHRGFVGESRAGTIFTIESGLNPAASQNIVAWIEGEGQVIGTSDGLSQTTWDGGFTGGTTLIEVGSSAGFANGDVVRLDSSIGGIQGLAAAAWQTPLDATDGVPDSTHLRLARPLPETFGSSGGQVREWTPATEIVLRDFTVRVPPAFANHQSTHSMILSTKGTRHFEATNLAVLGGYKVAIYVSETLDPYFNKVDVLDTEWDKGPTGIGVWASPYISGGIYMNSRIQHVTAVEFGSGVQNFAWIANDMPGPPQACADANYDGLCDSDGTTYSFDWQCNRDLTPNAGDCFIDEASHSIHDPIYSVASMLNDCSAEDTPYPCCTGDGTGTCTGVFTHCINSYDSTTEVLDGKGYSGSTSCHGSAAGAVYSCAGWHDYSGNGVIFARNSCGGPMWFDDTYGAGNRHFIFGNELIVGEADEFGSNPGDRGSFFYRSVNRDNLPAGYRTDAIWANNIVTDSFGSSAGGFGFDAEGGGDGVVVVDNTIGGSCAYRADSAINSPELETLCTRDTNTSSDAPTTPTTWQWNCVGDTEHDGAGCSYQSTETGGYDRTMPSLPFGSDWPFEFDSGNTPPPFVGPDAPSGSCLPAKYRLDGSC